MIDSSLKLKARPENKIKKKYWTKKVSFANRHSGA